MPRFSSFASSAATGPLHPATQATLEQAVEDIASLTREPFGRWVVGQPSATPFIVPDP